MCLKGFEPPTHGLEGRCSIQLSYRLILISPFQKALRISTEKRVMGIEPTYPAWKAGVLPLNYTRISIGVTGFEPATSWSQTRRSSQAEPHPVFLFPRRYLRDTNSIIHKPPLYVNNFFKLFSKNSSKRLPYFGKPVKSGFPDLLISYPYTVLSSTSGCFPFSNFITM